MFDSIFMLVVWHLCNERNECVSSGHLASPPIN
jgi:hypothetical protein